MSGMGQLHGFIQIVGIGLLILGGRASTYLKYRDVIRDIENIEIALLKSLIEKKLIPELSLQIEKSPSGTALVYV